MISSKRKQVNVSGSASAADIARYGFRPSSNSGGAAPLPKLDFQRTDKLLAEDKRAMRLRVGVSLVVLVVLCYVSLGVMGAQGQYYPGTSAYEVFTPVQVGVVLVEHVYNAFGSLTHLYNPHAVSWLYENVPGYFAMEHRAGVIGITLVCGILLSISGMLYQNVFKNPIAGPGMLGVGSGVSLGLMLLIVVYGASSGGLLVERYAFCYGMGAAILLFVILAGRKLSGKGKPFDIVTMLLVGSILSQLLGFIVSYVTMFVMDPGDYELYLTLSQMLVVDTTFVSWLSLGVASVLSIFPIWYLRFRLNALAFEEEEVRLFGIDYTKLRAVALICGAIMVLAAQVHTGMVGMVTLIVPFMARSWFGCEFRKQLVGCTCLGTILLVACRDLADLIPFVGDGIAIGTAVSVVALPLFVIIMAKHLRGWE